MLRWRETRKTRTSDILATRAKQVSCGPKKKTSERSPPAFNSTFCEQKISLACLSCNSDDSPACAKAFFSALRQKKRMGYCCFSREEIGGFSFRFSNIEDALPSTSRCTCRLNNVHTYQTTHLQSHCHMLLSQRHFLLSQIQCLTSRLAASCCVTPGGTGTPNALKRGARHHAVPHGGAAHARVADASKRAPLIDANSKGRSQCWSRSERTPLTGRVATRDPRRPSQSTKCGAGGGAYLQLCRVFA